MGIVVLDFGGQYAHLIANRVRRLNVWAEIRSPVTPLEELRHADGIILSGGPSSVYADDRPSFEASVLEAGIPILGICYGHQLLCQNLGGTVDRGDRMEYGAAALSVASARGVLAGLQPSERVWMSHGDIVREIPPGFETLASTEDCPFAAIGDEARRIYGLQFHPEVTHSEPGMKILENFLDVCQCKRDWTMESFIELETARLQKQTEGRKVFLLVSGGVDSTVAFLLLNQALGEDRVLGLHIDNGFMRKGETALVERLLKDSGFTNLEVVDAGAEFLARLQGMAEPEEKRRHIGEEFIAVRDRELARLNLDPDEWLLGQGTLYTDTIESGGTAHAEVIKTHHNRVGVIEKLLAEGKVVEPLAQLYKDEVRSLGETLGVPHHLVWRHPFPGPGLAVRCLCADAESVRAAASHTSVNDTELAAVTDKILRGTGLALDVLPLRSVGVQGDGRTYAHPALLTDADTAFLPGVGLAASWDDLERVSTDLTNSVPAINRVLFQLGPATKRQQILGEGFLTRDRLDILREADAIVMDALDRHELMAQVTQMPTVLVPLSSTGKAESIVLRPITTDDFMTARFDRLPTAYLTEVTEAILQIGGIEAVYYDVTHKPPGTVEWE